MISATHRDLAMEVAAGRFREDLYYRINVARTVIPPLRYRTEDIPALAEHILLRVDRRHGWVQLSLSPDALLAIQERSWPGNVRQLENALARAVIAARGRTILPEHLDIDDLADPATPTPADPSDSLPLRAISGRGRATGDSESLTRLRWQPYQACRASRHQSPPTI